MMPRPALLAPALLLVASAACSPSARMDSSDDMSNAGLPSNAQLGGTCSTCFDTSCGWEQTECAGDPECAQWLTTARTCAADAMGRPDSDCLGNALPDDATGRACASALTSCLGRAIACCSGGDEAPSGGAGAEGGGSLDYGDAGTTPTDGADGGTSGPNDGAFCAGCSCVDCLFAVKHGEVDDPACSEAIASCYDQNASNQCWDFASGYAMCALTTDIASPAICYQTLYSSPEKRAGLEPFLAVLPCAAQHCAAQCFPPAESACVTCQASSCLDSLEAFLAEPDAQVFRWCRQACQGDTSCVQACAAEHPNGLQVFQVLAQCTAASCNSECLGV